MRNRDQFDMLSFDTYRGQDMVRGNRGSDHNYGATSGHRDYDRETYHSSDYSLGSHGYGTPHMGSSSSYRTSRGPSSYSPSGYAGADYRADYNASHGQSSRYSDDRSSQGWIEQGSHQNGYESRHQEYDRYNNHHSGAYISPDHTSRHEYSSGWSNNRQPENYGHARDWSERASDEVKSWFGNDEAARRREAEERYDRYDRRSW